MFDGDRDAGAGRPLGGERECAVRVDRQVALAIDAEQKARANEPGHLSTDAVGGRGAPFEARVEVEIDGASARARTASAYQRSDANSQRRVQPDKSFMHTSPMVPIGGARAKL